MTPSTESREKFEIKSPSWFIMGCMFLLIPIPISLLSISIIQSGWLKDLASIGLFSFFPILIIMTIYMGLTIIKWGIDGY